MTEVVAEHVNSEGERVTIERVLDGAFAGQRVLVIYDDWPGLTKAPMLLDDGTVRWLRRALDDACPTCNNEGVVERLATPEEVDAGCELGVAYDPCPNERWHKPMRAGDVDER